MSAKLFGASIAPPTAEASLAVEHSAELGEGSIWDSRSKKLLWLDIMNSQLFRFDPVTKKNEQYSLAAHSPYVSSVVPFTDDLRNRDIVCVTLKDGFALFNFATQEFKRLGGDPAVGERERFNDGKADPNGRFWAGTITRDSDGEPCVGATLYRREYDGTVTPVLKDVSISNGIAWTKDSSLMYYIDTPTGKVDVFDYDPTSGSITNRRPCITGFDFDETGFPDGCTLDLEGMLWVACFNGGCARRFDPSTGTLLAEVKVPAAAGLQVTSVAFGGEKLEDLYLTTAREGFDEAKKKAHPLAGSLFVLKGAELNKLGACSGQWVNHVCEAEEKESRDCSPCATSNSPCAIA
eukprot:TRINITY_DN110083_c0_g1_i1.p1 TRINITY_DN110083_c0_g1~~TRINITY_DN110083_c0_g1_i1.p1  ORF type:complete len:393 (-),score=56.54 TRINITY_DN110083_c0_g1_i1:88-1137(-)